MLLTIPESDHTPVNYEMIFSYLSSQMPALDIKKPVSYTHLDVYKRQAENFALTERKDHAHVHRQMQGGVLDGLQGCQHGSPFF